MTQDTAAPRKREILGPTGLIVMVGAILLFTAVAIVIELAANAGKGPYAASVSVIGQPVGDRVQVVFHIRNNGRRAGRPDKCEATLLDIKGDRVGTASVSLHTDIQPGQSVDEPAVGTVANTAVSGSVRCRS